ncbi:hypothetical protein RclHR1_03660004 [Rhizophagus clarus]|nr:hypothetical protein RclHR1_03660004 [Rhizophagus clarus]
MYHVNHNYFYQFVVTNDDDNNEYIPSNDYSENSSNDEYIDKRIKNLDNSFLIWSSNTHKKVDDNEVNVDEIGEDNNNELEDKDNSRELEDDDYIELKNKNKEEELGDNDKEGLENKDKELKDYDNDELEDKDDNEKLEENDDNTKDKNEHEIDNFNAKLASLHSAKVVYNKESYKAKQIRIWAKYWIEYGILPKSLQGCHQKIKSIIDDEDVIE